MKNNEEKEIIKRVLTAMLDNKHVLISGRVTGLCSFNYWLYTNNICQYSEMDVFARYIHENRPSIFSSWNAFKNRNNSYFWTPYKSKERIKWIKEHLKKNS